MLGLDARIQKGRLYASAGGYVAPGFSYSRGSAEQRNLCDVCGSPYDRNFKLNLRDSDKSFAVQTGAHLDVGAFLTDNTVISIKGSYVFMQKMGGFNNTTSPTQQPARFDTNAAYKWSIGVELKMLF